MQGFNRVLTFLLIAAATSGSTGYVCPGIGNFPNPKNCNSYYVCAPEIEPTLMNCPVPLLFDPELKLCNNPESVKCSLLTTEPPFSVPTTEPPSIPPTTEPPSTPLTTATFPPLTDIPTESTTARPDGICPLNGTHRITNPLSCTSYYLCVDGDNNIISCPTGYGFYSEGQTCVPVAESDCKVEVPTTTPNPNQPNCPATGTKVYAHENDCFSFFLCDDGTAYLINCPVGFEFNRWTGSCDTPAKAGCSSGGSTTTPKPSPCQNKPDGATLPDPANCSTFYQCNKGNPVKQVCPPNLEFNAERGVCDFPESANCSVQLFIVPL